jgi:hypothetical protein
MACNRDIFTLFLPSHDSLGPVPAFWPPGKEVLGSYVFCSHSLLPRHLASHHVKFSFDLSAVVFLYVVK